MGARIKIAQWKSVWQRPRLERNVKKGKAFCTEKELELAIADEDANACYKIGEYGIDIIKEIAAKKNGEPVNILTHCNAGWLAFVDYGTATAPIYAAFDEGINVHVWVDETRPRNQGARLTAWELLEHGVARAKSTHAGIWSFPAWHLTGSWPEPLTPRALC